jgi:acetyltransferase-like isoleucine patch superfamily enzyme
MILLAPYIHPTAEISAQASIGAGTRIWAQAQVREFAIVGERCTISKGVYIDTHVRIGSNVKIQNNVSVFEGVTIDDGVYIGPHACFTNDMFPRAITLEGTLKTAHDWVVTPTHIGYGASVGAGAVVRCGVSIGRFALIGAGAVVTRDVAPHALVVGNPARPQGYVCRCAFVLERVREQDGRRLGFCPRCDKEYDITP